MDGSKRGLTGAGHGSWLSVWPTHGSFLLFLLRAGRATAQVARHGACVWQNKSGEAALRLDGQMARLRCGVPGRTGRSGKSGPKG